STFLELCLETHIHNLLTPSSRTFPYLLRLQTGHDYFLASNRTHLFTYDALDILQYTQAKCRVRIHTCHDLVCISSWYKELRVLGHFVYGGFLARLGKESGLFHG